MTAPRGTAPWHDYFIIIIIMMIIIIIINIIKHMTAPRGTRLDLVQSERSHYLFANLEPVLLQSPLCGHTHTHARWQVALPHL